MNRLLLEPPPTLSDERLAQLSAEGIDSAFAMLVLRHRRALVCHCAELVGQADAEEVAQEALLRAYLALARGEPVNHVGPWLRTIAHNTAVNLLRARAARPALSGHEPGPERTDGDTFERRETLREVVRALEELPDRQRQALVMRELEGRSYAEIEARLNTSNGAVRQLLNRARAAVRDRLDAVAGLIPAVRWILGDGGRAATAARLGALSGGCAVTIKLCTATVLPTLLVPGATAPKPPSSDSHAATVSGRTLTGTVAPATAPARSSRAALASRARFAPGASHQASRPNLAAAGTFGDGNASQPRARAWSRRSSSRTGAGSQAQSVAAPGASASGNGSATTPGGSSGASPTPLVMAPNVPSGSATAGGKPGSAPGGSTASPAAKSWGSSTGHGFASTVPGSGGMAPSTGRAGTQSRPQPGLGSS